MSENCSHNCESCGESCSERERESLLAKPHDGSHIKKVIGVVSGKAVSYTHLDVYKRQVNLQPAICR